MSAKQESIGKKPHSWGEVAKNTGVALGALVALAVGVEVIFD